MVMSIFIPVKSDLLFLKAEIFCPDIVFCLLSLSLYPTFQKFAPIFKSIESIYKPNNRFYF